MKILVPGGCGYIGAWLVPNLLVDGHVVTVLDTQWLGGGSLPDNGNLSVIKGDIRHRPTIFEAADGQDAVICLAGITSDAMCRADPVFACSVNMDGIRNVASAAANAGISRFILASSVAIYGSSERDVSEDEEPIPSTMYGDGKLYAEEEVMEHLPEATIVRCASVCGYSPRQRLDLTVNMMAHHAIKRGVITVNGGKQKRSHIHIKDASDFYKLVLAAPRKKVAGAVFNVVSVNQSVEDTASTVAEITGAKVAFKPRTDDRSYTVDGSKAKKVLGFTPKHTIASAVQDIKLRLDAGYWPKSETDPVYQNMLHDVA